MVTGQESDRMCTSSELDFFEIKYVDCLSLLLLLLCRAPWQWPQASLAGVVWSCFLTTPVTAQLTVHGTGLGDRTH